MGQIHRCHHGWPIKDSWRECPHCWAEQLPMMEADALEDQLRQSRKPSTTYDVPSAPTKSKFVENQEKEHFALEKAKLAEERFRMDDLSGAAQLITKAIELQPSFAPFYFQRARYFFLLGKKDQTVSDLHQFFTANHENFVDVENQLRMGVLDDNFSSKKTEFEALIHEMLENAEKNALTNYEVFSKLFNDVQKHLKRFDLETVNVLERQNQYIQKTVKSASYKHLIDIVENCNIMREVIDVLEREAEYKNKINELEPNFQFDQTELHDLENKERERQNELDKREERRAAKRKKLVSRLYTIVAIFILILTAGVLGWLTYSSWKSFHASIYAKNISLERAIGNIFWLVFNVILSIVTLIVPFYVMGKVGDSISDMNFYKNAGQRRWLSHEIPSDIKKLRLKVDEQKKNLNQLRHNLNNLSFKKSSLLKRIV